MSALWLLTLALLSCTGLHFSPPHSVRETVFATLTLAATLTIPILAVLGGLTR